MKKISFFFGAGAEYSYGLPSGGKFALDIFKMDTLKDKEELKTKISKIDLTSSYAQWLPSDVKQKKLTAFTKGQYESLIKGSLENKRDEIAKYLCNFDSNVNSIISKMVSEDKNIDEALEKILGEPIGQTTYGNEIKLNSIFESQFNNLFTQEYFSALLTAIKRDNVSLTFNRSIKNITRTILELLIGSLGEDLIHRLNDSMFEKSPDSIDLFDDLGSIFTLDYKGSGMRGLELLIDKEDYSKLDKMERIILEFGLLILEDIFSRALDYQTLIDTNWRYIYNPKTDWGKFSKIVIFLNTVRRYIVELAELHIEKINLGNGYYHDLVEVKKEFDLVAVGTSNYNTFIEDIIGEEVLFLNGSVKDYYDPYSNKIVKLEEDNNRILVPFLFTQSGIKPLTSVKMSRRYVDMYDKFSASNIICVCGFSFNSDDGHINGMFRELIEECNKEITILHYLGNELYNERSTKNYYKKVLRLSDIKGINIIPIDSNRIDSRTNEIWYKSLE